jgi:hypothetical protein
MSSTDHKRKLLLYSLLHQKTAIAGLLRLISAAAAAAAAAAAIATGNCCLFLLDDSGVGAFFLSGWSADQVSSILSVLFICSRRRSARHHR